MTTLDTDPTPQSFTGFAPTGTKLCPQCDYDLQNLPAAHRCPECGLQYDDQTLVWVVDAKGQRAFELAMLWQGVIWFSIYLFQWIFSVGPGKWLTMMLLPSVFFALFAASRYGRWFFNTRVAVAADRLIDRKPMRRVRVIHYRDVRWIRESDRLHTLKHIAVRHRRRGSKQGLSKVTGIQLPTQELRDVKRFVAAATLALEKWRAAQANITEGSRDNRP